MLKIRLQRVGRVHEPSFRLVLTDSKNSTKSGRFKEVLGSYDPRKETDSIKADRVKHWLSMGAKATGTVHNLLVTHGILSGKKVNVLPKKTVAPKAEAPAEPAPEAAPAEPASEAVEAPAEDAKMEESAPAEEAPQTEAPAE